MRRPMSQHPWEYWVTSSQNFLPYAWLPTDTPTRARFFLVHEWQVSEETRLVISRLLSEISTRRSMIESSTRKDSLLCLRRSAASTFKCLCKQTPLWRIIKSKRPQEPWRSRWREERDVEWLAPTHAHHTHQASRQLGTTADQRCDVPWDWLIQMIKLIVLSFMLVFPRPLWDPCHLARVCWGTRCKGFCSKEGPHYQIEQSARNQLECDQVQRALGKLSRSCHQTSNNQP